VCSKFGPTVWLLGAVRSPVRVTDDRYEEFGVVRDGVTQSTGFALQVEDR